MGEIADALLSGLKQVGDAGLDAAKTVAQLPLTIATLPTDFLKNPEVFMGGPRGVDVAAILSKDYRKQKAADIQGARDYEKLRQQASGVDWAQKLFFGPTSGMSPAEGAQAAQAAGIPQNMARLLQQRDYAESQAEKEARDAATASGMLPQVAAIADRDSAQQAGQSQFSDRLAREQNVQQAGLTRGNQSHEAELQRGLNTQQHGYRMTEAGYAGEVGAARDKYQSSLKDWNDERTQGRRFGNRLKEKQYAGEVDAAGDKYQAELDVWKEAEKKGLAPDPYPVLGAAYNRGVFRDNPQAEEYAYAHLTNPTDPKGAAELLNTLQTNAAKPSRIGEAGAQRKADAASAEQFLAIVGPDLRDGLLKKRALAAKGPQAVKIAERVIGAMDFADKDAGHLAALQNYTQLPSFQNAPQQTKDKVNAVLAAGDEAGASNVMSQIPIAPPKEKAANTADADYIKAVLADPVLGPSVPAELRQSATLAMQAGGKPAATVAADLANRLSGVSPEARGMLMRSPEGQQLLHANTGGALTIAGLDDLEQFRDHPELFYLGAGYGAQAADLWAKATSGDQGDFVTNRKVLEQKFGGLKAAYMQGISGAAISEKEVARLSKNLPDLDYDSHQTFFAKKDYLKGTAQRDQRFRDQLLTAMMSNDWAAVQNVQTQWAQSLIATSTALEAIEQGTLTPEQQAARQMSPEALMRAAGGR